MHQLLRAIAVPAACLLVAAGCGGGDGSGDAASSRTTEPDATTATTTTPDADDEEAAVPDAPEPKPATIPSNKPAPVARGGATYSQTEATNLALTPAEKSKLRVVAQRHLDGLHAATAPIPLEPARPGDSYLAGLGEFEYAAATYPIEGSQGPMQQVLFRRESDPRGPWKVLDQSLADDVSFPCSFPRPLVELWHPELVANGSCDGV